jgi:hypothetical protein
MSLDCGMVNTSLHFAANKKKKEIESGVICHDIQITGNDV